jgi:hypothetical protein
MEKCDILKLACKGGKREFDVVFECIYVIGKYVQLPIMWSLLLPFIFILILWYKTEME